MQSTVLLLIFTTCMIGPLFAISEGSEVVSRNSGIENADNQGLFGRSNDGSKLLRRNEVTPLHRAARDGDEEAIKSLLRNDADINALDYRKWTPLHFAVCWGHENAARLLLRNGASFDMKNRAGWTPLHYVASNGQEKVAGLLLESGASVDMKDHFGNTPLRFAATKGHEETAKVLLQYKASVDAQNNEGVKPLDWATRSGHKGMIKLLMDHGAKPQASEGSRVGSTNAKSSQASDIENQPLLHIAPHQQQQHQSKQVFDIEIHTLPNHPAHQQHRPSNHVQFQNWCSKTGASICDCVKRYCHWEGSTAITTGAASLVGLVTTVALHVKGAAPFIVYCAVAETAVTGFVCGQQVIKLCSSGRKQVHPLEHTARRSIGLWKQTRVRRGVMIPQFERKSGGREHHTGDCRKLLRGGRWNFSLS